MTKLKLLAVACCLLLFKTTLAQAPTETEAHRKERMQWWAEARFGMFIHWGIYSVPAGIYNGKEVPGIGEWIMNRGKIPMATYQQYAAQFNPVKFDADKFVGLAKQAGMKYIVITSKHHDGNHNIFHTGLFCQANKLIGIKLYRDEIYCDYQQTPRWLCHV